MNWSAALGFLTGCWTFMFRIVFAFAALLLAQGNFTGVMGQTSPSAAGTTDGAAADQPASQALSRDTKEGARLTSRSKVAILGYHRFENPARDSLAITPQMFREQMQALKDAGISVISMEDFLAWRRGEREIPERSALITIDDGYNCAYHHAWPILREFGYPFTFFVYSNYINAGGRSITWKQLAEMRDGGVHIGAHSVSHDNLARPRRNKPADYSAWLENEFTQIRNDLRNNLGLEVVVYAYPYGVHNEAVREMGRATGYEALFTVSGKHVTQDTPADEIGRFIVQSDKPQTFRAALQFGPAMLTAGSQGGPSVAVAPAHGSVTGDLSPWIWADLSSVSGLDPRSIEMRVSGLGLVPAQFNPESGRVSFRPPRRLHQREVTVQIRARAGGQRIEMSWQFQCDPLAGAASESIFDPPKNGTSEQVAAPSGPEA